MTIRIKRIYAGAARGDGHRVLVDRLWPRGISKQDARLDDWLRDVAPSDSLRKWFAHDPAKWGEFRDRYRRELSGREEPVAKLVEIAKQGPLTLVYGARDEEHNQAVVLREYLQERT